MPEYEDLDYRVILKDALNRLIEATAKESSEFFNRSRTWSDNEDDFKWALSQLKLLEEPAGMEEMLTTWLGESCGENEHWDGLAWHLGPGEEPNDEDGNFYLTCFGGGWSTVRYFITENRNDQLEIIYDFAPGELEIFLKKLHPSEWKDRLRELR